MPEALIQVAFEAAAAIDIALVEAGVITGLEAGEGALAFAGGTTFGISNLTLVQTALTVSSSVGLCTELQSE